MPKHSKPKVGMSIRIEEKLHSRVSRMANNESRNLNSMITALVVVGLKHYKTLPAGD